MHNERVFTETERLVLREMGQQDFESLCKILQDKDVMYAYEGVFTNKETQDWLDKQIMRYKEDGFGLNAVILKENGNMIGQCGLTRQDIPGKKVVETGYLFQKKYWHKGYATEAAKACNKYAFNVLGLDEVYSIIRDNNIASQNVAERNGMVKCGTFVKHYKGIDMSHYIFVARKE